MVSLCQCRYRSNSKKEESQEGCLDLCNARFSDIIIIGQQEKEETMISVSKSLLKELMSEGESAGILSVAEQFNGVYEQSSLIHCSC